MLENFDNFIDSIYDDDKDSKMLYGGHAGRKNGIIYKNENWMLKFPKYTSQSHEDTNLSYILSPLSEYIGSNIYNILGFDVQETVLGKIESKVVVACEDFLKSNEILYDYNCIKNVYSEEIDNALKGVKNTCKFRKIINLDELLIIMDFNPYFKGDLKLKEHFYDMFVIDSLISNNNRNEENWGIIINRENKNVNIAPVYDNGASFFPNYDDNKLREILNNKTTFKNIIYEDATSSFERNNEILNPLKYIKSIENDDLNKAVLRCVPKIKENLNFIKEFIYNIPNEFLNVKILTDIRKEFYYKSTYYIYENVLEPVYKKLK